MSDDASRVAAGSAVATPYKIYGTPVHVADKAKAHEASELLARVRGIEWLDKTARDTINDAVRGALLRSGAVERGT